MVCCCCCGCQTRRPGAVHPQAAPRGVNRISSYECRRHANQPIGLAACKCARPCGRIWRRRRCLTPGAAARDPPGRCAPRVPSSCGRLVLGSGCLRRQRWILKSTAPTHAPTHNTERAELRDFMAAKACSPDGFPARSGGRDTPIAICYFFRKNPKLEVKIQNVMKSKVFKKFTRDVIERLPLFKPIF